MRSPIKTGSSIINRNSPLLVQSIELKRSPRPILTLLQFIESKHDSRQFLNGFPYKKHTYFRVRSTEQKLHGCFLTALRNMFLIFQHSTCRYYEVFPDASRRTVEAQVSMALRYPSVPPNRSQRAKRQCQWLHELPADFPGITGF